MTIEKLRERKRELGYSNETLAEISGVPLGTLQKIFSGKTESPRQETIEKLTKALKANHIYENPYIDVSQVREGQAAYHAGPYAEGYTIDYVETLPEDERVEIIDGKLFVMEAPTSNHQRILGELAFQVSAFIRSNGGPCQVFFAPLDVQLDANDNKTMVQPDLIVLCDPKKDNGKRIVGAPDLLVEVLSKSNRKKDMILKLAKYEQTGVREYWMIDPDKKYVMKYDLEKGEFPVMQPLAGKLPVSIYDGKLEVDLDALAACIR